jgi:hypothetical protein
VGVDRFWQALDAFFDLFGCNPAKWQTNEIVAFAIGKKSAAVGEHDAELFSVFLECPAIDRFGKIER